MKIEITGDASQDENRVLTYNDIKLKMDGQDIGKYCTKAKCTIDPAESSVVKIELHYLTSQVDINVDGEVTAVIGEKKYRLVETE